MKKKTWFRHLLACVLAVALLVCCIPAGGLQAEAASGRRVTVCVDNKGGDDQPFMRIYLFNCQDGGPFTVHFQLKVSDVRRMAGHPEGGHAYVNIWHPNYMGKSCQNESIHKYRKNTDGWQNIEVTFDKVGKWMLSGVGLVDYALLDIGCIYTKAKIEVRDFTLKNAAGKLIWSFDTDPDLPQVTDLRDIGEVNPEPLILNASFGSSGNANFPVTVEEGNTPPPEKPSKETPAEKPSKETPAEKPSKEIPAEKPSKETPVEKPSEDAPVEESSTEELSEEASAPAEEDSDVQTEVVAPETPSEEKSEPKTQIVKKLNVPFIVTLSVLGVVVAAAVVVGIVYFVKKKKKSAEADTDSDQTE